MVISPETFARELERLGVSPADRVRSLLRGLVETRPFSLSDLEGVAVHRLGLPAPLVWDKLRDLVRAGDLVSTPLGKAGSIGKRSVIISFGALSEEDQDHYRRCFDSKRELFDPNELGRLGEKYAYWLLWTSELFNPGPKRRLGFNYNQDQEHPADLLIRYRDKTLDRQTGKLLVEFKNTRQIHTPNSSIFAELTIKAVSHGAQPILFVPYLTAEARSMCSALGIVVLELGRQLLPSKFKKRVKELDDIIGCQPFEFLTFRLYQAGVTEMATKDLNVVRQGGWISDAAPVWRSKVPLLDKYGLDNGADGLREILTEESAQTMAA